ncbi:MAG: MerC family mercury resistance protein [Xanthobacteraceae bacterium]
MNRAGRSRWFAVASLMAALFACYGTLALVGLLSVLGVSMAINATAWAGAIVVFAGLTAFGIALGMRCHRQPAPFVLALLGFALIGWAMLGRYGRTSEITGFAALAAATAWDWRARCRRLSGDSLWPRSKYPPGLMDERNPR